MGAMTDLLVAIGDERPISEASMTRGVRRQGGSGA